jgi:hypothetical protein
MAINTDNTTNEPSQIIGIFKLSLVLMTDKL